MTILAVGMGLNLSAAQWFRTTFNVECASLLTAAYLHRRRYTMARETFTFLYYNRSASSRYYKTCNTFLKQKTANMFFYYEGCSHHESDAHVVGLLDAVVLVRVLAEADEDGVDGHLKNRRNTFRTFY